MQDNVVLHSHFDYIIHKVFQSNPTITSLTGISNLPAAEINFQQYTDKDPATAPDKLSYNFINQYYKDPVRDITLSSLPPLMAFKKETFLKHSFNRMLSQAKLHPSLFYMVIPPDDMEAIQSFWKNKEIMPIIQRIKF
jgi:hypothetical protein